MLLRLINNVKKVFEVLYVRCYARFEIFWPDLTDSGSSVLYCRRERWQQEHRL